MNVRFVWPADLELDDAVRYYEAQQQGLGKQCYWEVRLAIERIQAFPSAWTRVGSNSRRCLLKRFPYALFYAIEEHELLILAVAHQHRDPSYVAHRLR